MNLPAIDGTPPVDVGQGEIVLLEEPLVVRGTYGPDPVFDTSGLGVEVALLDPSDIEDSILRVEENLLSPSDEVEKHVVAGELTSGSSQASSRPLANEAGACG